MSAGFHAASRHPEVGCPIQLTADSFVDSESKTVSETEPELVDVVLPKSLLCEAPGTLVNVNTLDSFKQIDRPRLLNQVT